MTKLEQLAAHFSAMAHKAGGAAAETLRLHVADTVGAWVAGARSEEGRKLARFAGASSLAGVADRVMLHCALARLSEVDDIHLASCTTPGAVVVPAALILGAERGASVEAVADSMLAGYEAIATLGAALHGPSILYRGIWPTYFTAAFGVAAAAARLLALDPLRAAHALALALTFAAPGVGRPGGPETARWLSFGHAARHGCTAAFAAREGFNGDLQLLDGDFFPSVYSISPDWERLDPARAAAAAIEQVSFKPWCGARQTMAAAQAIQELGREGLAPREIAAISVHVPPAYLKMVNHGFVAGERSSFLTSVPYQLAVSLLDPEAQFVIDPSGDAPSSAVADLAAKVTVQADDGLAAYYPASWPARVVVASASGAKERLVLHVPGDPQRAFGRPQVAEKFRRVLSPLLGTPQAAALEAQAFEALDQEARPRAVVAAIEAACSS